MNDTSAADYRHAMRAFATGVPIVACGRGGDRAGCVATALASLSLEPPSLLVNLALSGSTWARVRDCGHFSINILGAEHEALARRFAGGAQGAARFGAGDWREGANAPVLADALAALECRVEEILERHTHAIIIGRVEAATHREGAPLLHFGGAFLAG